MRLSLQACAGLSNRESSKVYMIHKNNRDGGWLEDLQLISNETQYADPLKFLKMALELFPRCVVYSQQEHQVLLPNIMTYAAVHDAIPMEESIFAKITDGNHTELEVMNATTLFQNHNTPVLATEYMFQLFAKQTSALAVLNPGFNSWGCSTPWNPPLETTMDPSLIDFVFQQKLFVVYLINSGIPLTADHRLMSHMTHPNNHPASWGSPVTVYGYADYWMVAGGFLFESYTLMTKSHNMGAIATLWTANLSFFSKLRSPAFQGEAIEPGDLIQNKPQNVTYQPDKTYVAFVVGDGDNVAYMMEGRANWMKTRTDMDDALARKQPLTWTISPHLANLAPTVMEWYYAKSKETGSDYFMLPPSGHLYAYPSFMSESVQNVYVAATEYDAQVLGTTATISWEWFTNWHKSQRKFLPKYGTKGIIQSIFPSNVPFLIPMLTWRKNQFFKVLRGIGEDGKKGHGNPVVLFKPREWRGVDGGNRSYYRPSPEKMASDLGSYPKGTVTYIYMSSDQGLQLSNSFTRMLRVLPDHVELVSVEAAAGLALHVNEVYPQRYIISLHIL